MSSVATTLDEIGAKAPANKTAVIIPDGGPSVAYGEFRALVASLADALRKEGIGAGDPVAVVLPNGLEFLVAFLAATWARAIAAPLNPAYKLEELRFYMEDIGIKAAIVPPGEHAARDAAAQLKIPVYEVRLDPPGGAELVCPAFMRQPSPVSRESERPTAEDVALFLHTSGTTSRPKGVPLRHGNLMASLDNIIRTYQ